MTDPIDQFCETGVQTNEGEVFEADVIILATGFDVTCCINVSISQGKTASPLPTTGPMAPAGTARHQRAEHPNLFIMYGPNTNMGHGGSGMWLAETQSNYITQRICDMVENNVATVECISELRDEYTDRIDELHADLIWAPGDSHLLPHRRWKGEVSNAFRLVDYWTMTNERGRAVHATFDLSTTGS